jgi:hypothetical protein
LFRFFYEFRSKVRGHWSRSGRLPHFRLFIRYGENSGDPMHAEPHVVHRATTNSSARSFSFRSKIEKEGLPRSSAPALETSAQTLVGKLTHPPREQEYMSALSQFALGWQR